MECPGEGNIALRWIWIVPLGGTGSGWYIAMGFTIAMLMFRVLLSHYAR